MSYAATIEMVAEDDLPAISYTIKDKNTAVSGRFLDPRDSDTWAIIDLSGATVTVDVRVKGSADVTETIVATIVDAVAGKILLPIDNAVFPNTVNNYELETRIVKASGDQQTVYDFMQVKVRSRIKSLII